MPRVKEGVNEAGFTHFVQWDNNNNYYYAPTVHTLLLLPSVKNTKQAIVSAADPRTTQN